MDTKQRLQNASVIITKLDDHTFALKATEATPGQDNFGFYIERDLGRPNTQLRFTLQDDGGVQISFDNYENLEPVDEEVIDSLNSLASS